jgi:hypothetical protein
MPIGYGKPDADKVPLVNLKLYSVALDVWPKRLLRDDGNPHLPAVHALFQIVRWYMPVEEFDGTKKETYYRRRYKGDQLQLSAPQLAKASGLTVKQARDALVYLEEKGYINHTLRTICRDGLTFPNSQFIALNVEAVIALSTVTVNDTNAMYEKAEENTDWDDDDYTIVPQEASALQGIRSDPQSVTTLGASALQDRPFSPQVIHHKFPHKLSTEEDSFFQKEGELENPSYAHPQDSLTIPSKSGLDVVKPDEHRALHNVVTTPVLPTPPAESIAQVFAAELPIEPITVKPSKQAKFKKAAATKEPKPPKAPRELNAKELAFLAKIEQFNPPIAPDVKQRLGEYSRSLPWSVAQVFLLTGFMPRPNNWHAIVSLNGVAFDEKRMVDCYNEWTERGYNERGLAWLLEWYKAGGPPQYTPRHNAPDAYAPPPKPQALEWEDSPIGREAIARMAKQKAEKEQEMKGQEYASRTI